MKGGVDGYGRIVGLFRALLPAAQAEAIDFDEVFRFAQHFDCRQIALTCRALSGSVEFSTQELIDFVRQYRMDSNVDLRHVEKVQLSDLKGMEPVLEALRVHLLTPLQNSGLVRELNLRPKRGVVLHGPPGTGKTSIGRALAHVPVLSPVSSGQIRSRRVDAVGEVLIHAPTISRTPSVVVRCPDWIIEGKARRRRRWCCVRKLWRTET